MKITYQIYFCRGYRECEQRLLPPISKKPTIQIIRSERWRVDLHYSIESIHKILQQAIKKGVNPEDEIINIETVTDEGWIKKVLDLCE